VPPRELLDATADGITLVRVGVEVDIPLIGIDAEDGEAGAAVRTADAAAKAARAEDTALCEANAKSLEDLITANNSMSMDAALAWFRQDWEREQAEQQWRLLDLAAARRRADAAAQPARGAPVVKLEDSSDDDWYRPTPPRFGDAGQGSSRWAPGQSSQQASPTTTTTTTRCSTAIWACRTPCF
jgi:hypothetical protein